MIPDNKVDELRLLIVTEAQEANATIERVGLKLKELAEAAGVPIKIMGGLVKDMGVLDKAYDPLINKATSYAIAVERAENAQAKLVSKSNEKVSQLDAIRSVDETNALFAQRRADEAASIKATETQAKADKKLAEQRAYNYGKELEDMNRIAALNKKRLDDQEALNVRLRNGTASIKEYVAALRSGEGLNKKLSQNSLNTMGNIQPGVVDRNTINQVAGVMREIQSITRVSTEKVKQMVKEMFPRVDTRNIDLAAKKIQGFPSVISKAFRDIGNVIKGTLTAMFVFNLQQAVSQFFQQSYDEAVKYRAQLVQLNFAEAMLSQKGMEITREELDKIVEDIKEASKYLSKVEVTSIVGEVSNMAIEFGLTKDQIAGVSAGIAYMNLQAKISGKEAMDAGSALNALGDIRSNYFNAYGINITKQAVEEKAIKMELVEQGKEIDKNTMRQAAYALFIEQTTSKQEEFLSTIEKTNPQLAHSLQLAQDMADVKLTLGDQLLIAKGALDEFLVSMGEFDSAASGLSMFGKALLFIEFMLALVWKALTTVIGLSVSGFAGLAAYIGDIFIAINKLIEGDFVGAIAAWTSKGEDAGKAMKEAVKRGWEMGGNPFVFADQIIDPTKPYVPETPTGPKPPEGGGTSNAEDLKSALEKMNKEILDAEIKLGQDLENVQIDYERKLEDITIEYKQKKLDIERDYANKIADINRDYANRIADLDSREQENRQKYRNQEIEREKAYQEKLKQLREQFMMDMEEALHARDARQILKLIKTYNLEKVQAERQYKLDKENAAREEKLRRESYERERQQLEEERLQKLEDAARERDEKLAQMEADKKAEEEQAALDRAREIEDLNKHNADRLAIIAANLVEEFNLTQDNLNAILALYLQHYNDVSAIYAAMQQMWMGMRMMGGLGGPTGGPHNPDTPEGGFAEGGTLFANRPTSVMFGEAGLEMATFTPIGKTGRDVNKVFSALGGSGSSSNGGKIEIQLNLSPDLEARITSNTMNRTAGIITRIGRKK